MCRRLPALSISAGDQSQRRLRRARLREARGLSACGLSVGWWRFGWLFPSPGPGGNQTSAGSATGGRVVWLRRDLVFAGCTPGRSPVGLRLPGEGNNQPRRKSVRCAKPRAHCLPLAAGVKFNIRTYSPDPPKPHGRTTAGKFCTKPPARPPPEQRDPNLTGKSCAKLSKDHARNSPPRTSRGNFTPPSPTPSPPAPDRLRGNPASQDDLRPRPVPPTPPQGNIPPDEPPHPSLTSLTGIFHIDRPARGPTTQFPIGPSAHRRFGGSAVRRFDRSTARPLDRSRAIYLINDRVIMKVP
jgi:hypothetical protein